MNKLITSILIIPTLLFSFGSKSQNNSLNFDGVNDFVQTTYSGVSGGTAARSIEAWIKTTGNYNPSTSGTQGVIADYGSFVTGGRFTFCVLWGNAIRIEVGGNGLSGSIAVNDGNWHHVAVVYNPTATNKYSLYVDSVLDVSGNLTVGTNTGTSSNFRIGQRIDNVNNFNGNIDEVRFYNYARTAAQIANERKSEYCTIPAGLTAYYKFNEGNAGLSNIGITSLLETVNGNNGIPTGFSLTGSTSNFVAGSPILQGSTYSSTSISTCGSYTLPSGTIASTSGTYYDTLTTSGGCDSVMAYVVTISTAHIANSYSFTNCDTFLMPNGLVVRSTGVYFDTLSTLSSCDTVDQYTVTILPGVNNNVTKSGNKLTSTDTWAVHQWVDCNNGYSLIPGATAKDYTPTVTGSYACIISRGSCIDTSACTQVVISTIGLEEQIISNLSLFPNPTRNIVYISHPDPIKEVKLLDLTGKIMITQNTTALDLSLLPTGIYFVQVKVSGVLIIKKIVKE